MAKKYWVVQVPVTGTAVMRILAESASAAKLKAVKTFVVRGVTCAGADRLDVATDAQRAHEVLVEADDWT